MVSAWSYAVSVPETSTPMFIDEKIANIEKQIADCTALLAIYDAKNVLISEKVNGILYPPRNSESQYDVDYTEGETDSESDGEVSSLDEKLKNEENNILKDNEVDSTTVLEHSDELSEKIRELHMITANILPDLKKKSEELLEKIISERDEEKRAELESSWQKLQIQIGEVVMKSDELSRLNGRYRFANILGEE